MTLTKTALAVAAFGAALSFAVPAGAVSFPGFGANPLGPALIITVAPGGGFSVTAGPSVNIPYDGSEDTYIGVINASGSTVTSVHLSSSLRIFGFDGDGIDTYGAIPAPGNPDTTGYGGPLGFFSGINAALTAGDVNFFGGLADGASTYFSLEEAIPLSNLSSPGPVPGAGSLGFLALGLGGAALKLRERLAR